MRLDSHSPVKEALEKLTSTEMIYLTTIRTVVLQEASEEAETKSNELYRATEELRRLGVEASQGEQMFQSSTNTTN